MTEEGAPNMPTAYFTESSPRFRTSTRPEIEAFNAYCRGRHGRTQTNVAVRSSYGSYTEKTLLLENDIRLEERSKERARIVQELHDTLLQGFVGASLLLYHAAEQTPADSPSQVALRRALDLVNHAIDEGRAEMRGLRTGSSEATSLERAFANLLRELATGWGPRPRVLVRGETRVLDASIQEQLYMVAREAIMNALRHSEATEIDIEVQYRRDSVRVFVRDNGRGINPEAVQKKSDSHWGLRGMRDRAENIGARFEIRSSPGRGTEVGVAVDLAGLIAN